MNLLPNFFRSLLLTILLCFVVPTLLVTFLLASVSLIGYVPGLETIGQTAATLVLRFLAVFGNGRPVQGVIVIGFTCSLVGALFDTYASTVIRT